MLIKALSHVTTSKEKRTLKNVKWGRVSYKNGNGSPQRGTITGIWQQGCSLVTRHNVLAGENIWIRAKDELGRTVLSLVGTVTWTDNVFRLDGYRCEVRFSPG